jgi:GR25 family glycosyltransferase involved in LPS biosynthesis
MFTKILYINLDRRSDRNQNVINELTKIDLYNENVIRIPGVDWKTIDFTNLSRDIITETGIVNALDKNAPVYIPMTKGGIGVALAHRNAFLKVLELEDEYVLILEDDIHIVSDFKEKLNEYLKTIPTFDILFIGFHQIIPNYNIMTEIYTQPYNIWGLFSYIINKKAATELLKIFPINEQIDTEISKAFPFLNVYCLNYENRLIHSEGSSTTSEFGTDIQIREDFFNINNNNDNDNINILIFIIILIILLYFILKYNKKIIN